MQQFKARENSSLNDEQANSYGQDLFRLMKKTGKDLVTPEEVVEDAKNPQRAYHEFFEWNDKIAGEQFRLTQARYLLGAIEVTVVTAESEPLHIRAFHNVIIEGDRGYAKQEFVFNNANATEQVVEHALREAKNWANRYRTYKKLNPIVLAIDSFQ